MEMTAATRNTTFIVAGLIGVPAMWAYAVAFSMAKGMRGADHAVWGTLGNALFIGALLAWLATILVSGKFGGGWRRTRELPLLVIVPPLVFFFGARYLSAAMLAAA
jgi:hypothetical protein